MYNWDTNTRVLKKHSGEYTLWKLNQLINFGLNNQKLNLKQVKSLWKELKIDPKRSNFLHFLIWGNQS